MDVLIVVVLEQLVDK